MEAQSTLFTVISIFLLLMAGYGAKKVGVLKTEDAGVVNALVINLTMPAFIFVYTHGKPLTTAMVKAPFLGFAMEMVVVGIAYLSAKALKLNRPTTGALMLVAAFGNTAFLGYPVVTAAFKGNDQAILTAVLFDEFGIVLIVNTIGIAIAACFAGSKFQWKSLLEFLKTPLFPMTVVALILKDVYIPQVIMKTLGYLAAGTVPLAMISIGLNLSTGAVRQQPLALLVALSLKLAVLPFLVYLTLPLIGVSGTVAKVVVLQSAMPSAVFTGVVASRYGANAKFAASTIFVGTILSVFLIPWVLMLLK